MIYIEEYIRTISWNFIEKDILELAHSNMQLTKPTYRIKFIIRRKTIFDPNSSRVQIRKKKRGGEGRSIGFQRLTARVRERDKIDYEHSSITILVEIAKLFKK